ncbi:MAG: LytR/AlgR family response regulator transcription factor [Betaproteobacteria bacterium]
MRVIVVDDEARAREVLRYYLEKAGVEVVGEAGNGAEAINLVRERHPDVCFLDVRMPEVDGIELARLLSGTAPPPRVVFVTAYEDHAVAAFETEAVDYLVKPINAARVLQTVERLRRLVGQAPPSAPCPSAPPESLSQRLPVEVGEGRTRRIVLLDTKAILAIEARGKGAVVRTARTEYETPTGLWFWERTLPEALFLRVHRGFLVNLQAVRELFTEGRSTFLRLDGRPEAIPVSRERLPELRHRLSLPE